MLEIKQGMGSIPRTHENITLWFVVLNGHHIATFSKLGDAQRYCDARYGSVPKAERLGQ